MFEYRTSIQMGQVDAAGVIFAPRLLELSHTVFEAFLAEAGWSVRRILDEGWALPLVHLEADFQGPLRLGDGVRVELRVARLGESSFALDYRFIGDGRTLASAGSVHAALKSGGKIPLPEAFRQMLTPHL